jgi:chromosome segregation ATPase
MDVLAEGMQQAMAGVRAAESSLNGKIVEKAQKMEAVLDVAHRSEEKLSEELKLRTVELFEVQVTLEALHSEMEGHRASSAADAESRNALLQELAKTNEAVVAAKDAQKGLRGEVHQAREELSARHAELQQARDELRARSEGTSASRLREEELGDKLAGLLEAERTLQAELVNAKADLQAQLGMARAEIEDVHAELGETRAAVSKNHRAVRDKLAQVRAELEAGQAELQKRQKGWFRLRSKKADAPKAAL